MSTYHPGEVVQGANSDFDALTVELDDAVPGRVLVGMSEHELVVGSIYLKPVDARELRSRAVRQRTKAES